jgi:hypothetical protein
MSRSRTIILELLRDGPSHNQLLSPLTVYLAVCQNRPPESLRLTVEHRDFLRWQGALSYVDAGAFARSGNEQNGHASAQARFEVERRNALDDAGAAVTALLGSIRALIAELASEPCDWRHIHLVLDAAELGALPFELAHAAPGLMVEGERLFVQQNARVTLTRQTRRIATSVVTWPRRPRLLCIVADGNLPGDAHVLALRKSIDLWIGWNDGDEQEASAADDEQLLRNRSAEAAQMLTVLENPSLDEVSTEARRTRYTHVHILAHGAPLPYAGPSQTLYGLCFRGAAGGTDVVDGDRLDAALRHLRDCTHPTVVTLATCEGANVSGGILGPGGSAAHALHAKGVPLVIAAQFPLSKGGSAIFAEMLYGGLLRGEDPRQVVHSIRRELLVAYPDTHDWASVVVYGSFPVDLDSQLARVKQTAEKLAGETAVERLRVTLRRYLRPPADARADAEARLRADADRLDRATDAIRAWTGPENDATTRVLGHRLLARIAMRMWDVYTLRSPPETNSVSDLLQQKQEHDVVTGQRPISMLRPSELLERAKHSYEAAYFLDPSWALSPRSPGERFRNDLRALRYMAQLMAERVGGEGLGGREASTMAAAMSFEVELLAHLALAESLETPGGEANRLDEAFERFLKAAAPVSESYRAHTMWRQLRRYERWLDQMANLSDVPKPDDAASRVIGFRQRLEALGVRKYWGPRA